MNFESVRNNRTNVMRPFFFPSPAGSLSGFDRAAAVLADLSRGVCEVVFFRMLLAFLVEVGIRKPSALACKIALLWCKSGHRAVFTSPVVKP
jgi:hypothetical protein